MSSWGSNRPSVEYRRAPPATIEVPARLPPGEVRQFEPLSRLAKRKQENNQNTNAVTPPSATSEGVRSFPVLTRLFPEVGPHVVEAAPPPTTTNPGEVRTFPIPDGVRSRALNRQRQVLPRYPEPFVPLTNETHAPNYLPPGEVRTFPAPSRLLPPDQRPMPQFRPNPQPQSHFPQVREAPAPAKPTVQQMPAADEPDVTIVIPLYNGIEFVEDALLSIKRQTYTNWTGLIGVNGHGDKNATVTAKAAQIVESQGLKNRFQVLNLTTANSAPEAINQLVSQATTPYIAHIDADDLWLSKKLEFQMHEAKKDPELGVLGTMCRFFGESNGAPNIPSGPLNKNDFVRGNPLIHSSILIKKELSNYTNEFVTYDYDCWIRNLLADVKMANLPGVLTLHRIHRNSFFNASGNQNPDLVRKKYGIEA